MLAFQDFGLRELVTGRRPSWVGLENFREVLADPLLWKVALPNTVVFAVGRRRPDRRRSAPLVALLLARLGGWARGVLHQRDHGGLGDAGGDRAPTSGSSSSTPATALVMRTLGALGWSTPTTTNWFTERLPFYGIATLNVVHHGFPFVAVTVLAGLMTLPQDTLEAAALDGAGAWKRFWHVTVPLLKPVFAVVTILSTIWDFKVFTQIYLMPGGSGTNRDVLNLGTWSYITAISQNRYGLGAAIAVLLTLLLLVITLVYLRTLFKQDDL